MKFFRNSAAVAALLVVCTAGTSLALPLSLDIVGVGTPVSTFDWSPGNALAVGSIPLSTDPNAQTAFTLHYQARLATYNDANNVPLYSPNLNGYELTTVVGFGEKGYSTNAGQNANFTLDLANPTNYVRFYADAAQNSSDLAGTGFADGNLVLTGRVISMIASNFGANLTAPPVRLDGFGADNWGGQLSVSGTGSTAITIQVLSYDNTFILNPNLDYLHMLVNFNTSNNLPFLQTNPAQSMFDGTGQLNTVGTLGFVNGVVGPNMLFQADGNSSFEIVPEPSTIALLGLGLAGMAGLRYRRARK
jgi:hypothetical protein